MDDGVPLVVAGVNDHAARSHSGLIANPNCSTMQLVPVLAALHRRSPLEHVTVATYQSVSGTGQKAVDALRAESAAVLAGEDPPAGVYAHRIAFNALPFAGSLSGDDGYTDEELKLVNESRKILEQPELRVSATCVRVPVMNSHSEAVWVRTREPIAPDEARALLAAEDGITVVDDPAAGAYPMAIDADGRDDVLVGRIRRDLGDPNALALWVVADNLRKGAATNAVQLRRADPARPPAPLRSLTVRVAVVGAGFAGLACAIDLARAGATSRSTRRASASAGGSGRTRCPTARSSSAAASSSRRATTTCCGARPSTGSQLDTAGLRVRRARGAVRR